MQVLKEAMRQRIIKSSKKEFRKKGFHNASMRDIADSADMTVGNLYRYYKNKQDIFNAIINELFMELKKLIDGNDKESFSHLLNSLIEILRIYTAEWIIISNATKGTKYARIVVDLFTLLSQAMIDEYGESESFDESIAPPVIQAIISGIVIILQNEKQYGDKAIELFVAYILKNKIG
jgi:AcrR family transcriptional regulator